MGFKETSQALAKLTEMYNMVIQFQTNRSVLQFMKQQASQVELAENLQSFTDEIVGMNQLALATGKFLSLLQSGQADLSEFDDEEFESEGV
jgi:hypothetical protein